MPILEMWDYMSIEYLFQIVQIEADGTYKLSNNIDASCTMQAAPAWAQSTDYELWEVVRNGGNIYQCKEAHTSGSSFDSSKWILVRAEVPLYSNSSTYAVGDVVRYPTSTPTGVYQCKVAITTPEEWNSANWVLVANLDTNTWPTGFVGLCRTDANAMKGTLNGNGFVISNLYQTSNATELHGLFGYIEDGAVIQNLTFDGCCLRRQGTGSLQGNSGLVAAQLAANSITRLTLSNVHVVNSLVHGGRAVGSLIGGNPGLARGAGLIVENCSSNAVVKSVSTYSIGVGVCVGGLVGSGVLGLKSFNTGVRNCLFSGTIKVNSSSSAKAGGIYGSYNTSSSTAYIQDCIFIGTISGAAVSAGGIVSKPMSSGGSYGIERCLNAGVINLSAGNKYGICEGADYVVDSYYDTETSGCTDQPSQQRTTAQMKQRAWLKGLDFNSVWYLPKSPVLTSPFNNGYPIQRALLDVGSGGGGSARAGLLGGIL